MTLTDEKTAISEHDQRASDTETADTTTAKKQAYLSTGDGEYNIKFKTWVVVMVSTIETTLTGFSRL